MKNSLGRFNQLIIAVLLWLGQGGSIAFAQTSNIPLAAPPPAPVTQASVNPIGRVGNKTYYYYIVARYPIGTSIQSPGFEIINANDTLSAQNYVRVAWNPPNGQVINYDVLRLITPGFPSSGTCTSCLIASATTANAISDMSNTTLGNYTLSSAQGAFANISLNNISQNRPAIKIDGQQLTYLQPTQNIDVDFGGVNSSRPAKVVSQVPTTCDSIGQFFYVTSATAGQNIYLCTAVNVLTQVSTSTATGNMIITTGAAPPSGACTPNVDWYVDTSVTPNQMSYCYSSGVYRTVPNLSRTGTFHAGFRLPELTANGTDAVGIFGRANQASSGCIVLTGQGTTGQALVDSGSTESVALEDGVTTLTCRVVNWATISSTTNPTTLYQVGQQATSCPGAYTTLPGGTYTIPTSVALAAGDSIEFHISVRKTGAAGNGNINVKFSGFQLLDEGNWGLLYTFPGSNATGVVVGHIFLATATEYQTGMIQFQPNEQYGVNGENLTFTGVAYGANPVLEIQAKTCTAPDTFRVDSMSVTLHKAANVL